MSERHTKIAFKQIVRREWLDRTLELVCAGVPESEIRKYLDEYISTQQQRGGEGIKRNKASYGMSITLLSCWFRNDELNDFRNALLEDAKKVDRTKWLPFHMAMLSASYPFFFTVCIAVGRLFSVQDKISSSQIYNKMKEQFGDNETIARNTRYVIRTMVSWDLIIDCPERKGYYTQGSVTEIHNQKVAALLIEAVLQTNKDGRLLFEDLYRSKGLFGFKFDYISAGTVAAFSNNRIEVTNYGLSDEYLELKNENK